MAAQQKKNEKKNEIVEPTPEVDVIETATDEENNENEKKQNTDRQKEWGQQFDKWLINAARRGKTVEILLSLEYPGFTTDGNLITGIPKRVDKEFMQMIVHGKEVWLSKAYFVGCTPVITTSESPA